MSDVDSLCIFCRVIFNVFYKGLANVFTQVKGWYSIFLFLGFLSQILTIHRTAGEVGGGGGGAIYLTPSYHFHPLHRHLDISWVISAESSHLHIASNRPQTKKLWFPSASC